DQSRRDVIDARNAADSLAYATEKTVNENRDRLPADDVARIEAAVNAAREAAKSEDSAAIRRATEELQKSSHALAEQLYKQAQNDSRAQGASGADAPGNDVKEGEVVDA